MPDNTALLLERHFDLAFAAPDGVQKLRELILTLAMQGKLVPQDPDEQPASELLKAIEVEKQRLVKEGKIKQPKPLTKIKSEEIPYELLKEWEWVRLEDVSTKIHYGYTASANHDLKDVRLLRITDIQDNKVDWESVPGCEIKEKDVTQYLLANKDILIARTGGTVGKSYLVENISVKAVFASYLIRVVPSERIDVNYLKLFIECPLYWKQLYEKCSGTGQPNVNGTSLSTLLLPLPPLAEQHRIVAKIDRLMARCDELEKLRAERDQKRITIHTAACDRLLTAKESDDFGTAWRFITQHFGELYSVKENVSELRKAILQLAVMGKLVPQDPTDEPASELLRAIAIEKQQLVKEGKIREQKPLPKISPEEISYALPKSWEWVRIDDLCFGITSGSTPPNNIFSDKEGIPFLKVYNIRNQKVDFQHKSQFINEEYHLKSKRSCLKPGDVIMNIVGPPLGKVAIIPNDFPEYNCNQAIVFFRPVIQSLNEYLYLYLLSGKFLDRIELIGTAGQDNISVTKSRSIRNPSRGFALRE